MRLRHWKRKLQVQTVLVEAPPGAGASWTALNRLRHERLSCCVWEGSGGGGEEGLQGRRVSRYLGNVSISMGYSWAGLCRRRRPVRLRCGAHSGKSVTCKASGSQRARSCEERTARLLMTPLLCRSDVSSLIVPQARNLRLKKLIDIGSWAARSGLFTQRQDLLLVFLSTNLLVGCHVSVSAHFISCENPPSVSDGPRYHRRIWCNVERRDFCLG